MEQWEDGALEIKYRYWVCEKNGGAGWTAIAKTNWLWRAKQLARRKARKGFRMKVEAQW